MIESRRARRAGPRIVIVGARAAGGQRMAMDRLLHALRPAVTHACGWPSDVDAVVLAQPTTRARTALQRLQQADPACLRIVVATGALTADEAQQWLTDGADAILPRLLMADELHAFVLRLIAVRRPAIDVARIAQRRIGSLNRSTTEHELVLGILRGGSNDALSRALDLSQDGVRGRLQSICPG